MFLTGAKGVFSLSIMAYQGTATRKRPQVFDGLVGQEFVVATLKSSIRQERIAHAYLFSGPRGVGKTSAARILAKALNCETGLTDTPCGKCTSCQEITRGNSMDVIEIDGASNTSVNDVREIKDEVLFSPANSRYKVYIIDEVHMLSNSAFNALLKTIEEPPPYVIFIFATTEVHKIPPTIRSRCQQFNFRLISSENIKQCLMQVADEMELKADEEALFWIAKESTGSLRDAYTLFDQIASFSEGNITLDKLRNKLGIMSLDEINDLVGFMVDGSAKEILEYAHQILDQGVSIEQLIIDLADYFRGLLFFKHGIKKDSLLGFSLESIPPKNMESLTVLQLEKAIELLLGLYKNLKFTLNSRLELELLLSRLSKLDHLITPQEIYEKLDELRSDKNLHTEGRQTFTSKPSEPLGSAVSNVSRDQELLKKVIESIKKEKLALASSLEKAASWNLEANELILNFYMKDKFSGELALKERDTLIEKVSAITSQPVKMKINFIEDPEREDGVDTRADILKRVFRGDIVKGD